MALNAQALCNEVIAAIDSYDWSDARKYNAPQFFYIDTIKSYIEANAVITYQYTGMTTSGIPVTDPLCGPHTCTLELPGLASASAVKALVSSLNVNTGANQDGFISALIQDINTAPIVNFDNQNYIGATTGSCASVVPVDSAISQKDNYKDVWLCYCQAIIDSVLTFVGQPFATVTSSPGAGTSVFVSIV